MPENEGREEERKQSNSDGQELLDELDLATSRPTPTSSTGDDTQEEEKEESNTQGTGTPPVGVTPPQQQEGRGVDNSVPKRPSGGSSAGDDDPEPKLEPESGHDPEPDLGFDPELLRRIGEDEEILEPDIPLDPEKTEAEQYFTALGDIGGEWTPDQKATLGDMYPEIDPAEWDGDLSVQNIKDNSEMSSELPSKDHVTTFMLENHAALREGLLPSLLESNIKQPEPQKDPIREILDKDVDQITEAEYNEAYKKHKESPERSDYKKIRDEKARNSARGYQKGIGLALLGSAALLGTAALTFGIGPLVIAGAVAALVVLPKVSQLAFKLYNHVKNSLFHGTKYHNYKNYKKDKSKLHKVHRNIKDGKLVQRANQLEKALKAYDSKLTSAQKEVLRNQIQKLRNAKTRNEGLRNRNVLSFFKGILRPKGGVIDRIYNKRASRRLKEALKESELIASAVGIRLPQLQSQKANEFRESISSRTPEGKTKDARLRRQMRQLMHLATKGSLTDHQRREIYHNIKEIHTRLNKNKKAARAKMLPFKGPSDKNYTGAKERNLYSLPRQAYADSQSDQLSDKMDGIIRGYEKSAADRSSTPLDGMDRPTVKKDPQVVFKEKCEKMNNKQLQDFIEKQEGVLRDIPAGTSYTKLSSAQKAAQYKRNIASNVQKARSATAARQQGQQQRAGMGR